MKRTEPLLSFQFNIAAREFYPEYFRDGTTTRPSGLERKKKSLNSDTDSIYKFCLQISCYFFCVADKESKIKGANQSIARVPDCLNKLKFNYFLYLRNLRGNA